MGQKLICSLTRFSTRKYVAFCRFYTDYLIHHGVEWECSQINKQINKAKEDSPFFENIFPNIQGNHIHKIEDKYPIWFGKIYLYFRILLFKEPTNTRNSSTSSNACYKYIHLASCIFPNFWTSCFIVYLHIKTLISKFLYLIVSKPTSYNYIEDLLATTLT